jgi:hypothetical protein
MSSFGAKVLTGSILAMIGLFTVRLLLGLFGMVTSFMSFMLFTVLPIALLAWLGFKVFKHFTRDRPADVA